MESAYQERSHQRTVYRAKFQRLVSKTIHVVVAHDCPTKVATRRTVLILATTVFSKSYYYTYRYHCVAFDARRARPCLRCRPRRNACTAISTFVPSRLVKCELRLATVSITNVFVARALLTHLSAPVANYVRRLRRSIRFSSRRNDRNDTDLR